MNNIKKWTGLAALALTLTTPIVTTPVWADEVAMPYLIDYYAYPPDCFPEPEPEPSDVCEGCSNVQQPTDTYTATDP